jgi:phage terminase large subunit-like protein
LQTLADEGLPVEEFPQSPARMTPATQRFGEVVEPGTHPFRDPDLARHVGNTVVRNDSRGHRIVKEHKDSMPRIDLAVAAVMAFAVASATDPGPQLWVFDE